MLARWAVCVTYQGVCCTLNCSGHVQLLRMSCAVYQTPCAATAVLDPKVMELTRVVPSGVGRFWRLGGPVSRASEIEQCYTRDCARVVVVWAKTIVLHATFLRAVGFLSEACLLGRKRMRWNLGDIVIFMCCVNRFLKSRLFHEYAVIANRTYRGMQGSVKSPTPALNIAWYDFFMNDSECARSLYALVVTNRMDGIRQWV